MSETRPVVLKLLKYAFARDRDRDKEVRTITITDDEAVDILHMIYRMED